MSLFNGSNIDIFNCQVKSILFHYAKTKVLKLTFQFNQLYKCNLYPTLNSNQPTHDRTYTHIQMGKEIPFVRIGAWTYMLDIYITEDSGIQLHVLKLKRQHSTEVFSEQEFFNRNPYEKLNQARIKTSAVTCNQNRAEFSIPERSPNKCSK